MENWLIFVCFGVILLFLGCCAVLGFVLFRTWRTLLELSARMGALEVARAGAQQFARRGVEAREQYSNRRQAAIFEAIAAFKAGHKLQDILLAVAQKYPDVAVQIAQNPDVIMQDIKRMGIDLPPEILQQLGQAPPASPPKEANKPAVEAK